MLATSLESKAGSQPPEKALKMRRLELADHIQDWGTRWHIALRGCGGSILRPNPTGDIRLVPRYCNKRFCPECRERRRAAIFAALRPAVVRIMAEHGGAALITLTAPHGGSLDSRTNRILAAIRRLGNKQAWKRKKRGLATRVGVVWAFELTPGDDGDGHPHLHIMVFSASTVDISEYIQLLVDHWKCQFPGVRISSGAVERVSSDPGEWGPRLYYILKGIDVSTSWPMVPFDVAMMLLSSGKQLHRRLGLLKSGLENSTSSTGNHRKATA